MSKNLLKGGMVNLTKEESRIIDANALIAQRIGMLAQELQEAENAGFTEGLKAEKADISALLADQEETQEEELPEELSAEEAQERARTIVQEAKDAASKILQDAIAQSEAESEAIRQKAREEGYQEGFQKAESEFHKKEKELKTKERELEKQYDSLVEELEPKFVDTLSEIYEHLFHVELGSHRDILLYLIGDCMRGAEGSKSFQIRVSKDDFTYISAKKAGLLEAAGAGEAQLEILEDPAIPKNGCMIRTENGIMDCSLETQLEELNRKLRLLAYEKK